MPPEYRTPGLRCSPLRSSKGPAFASLGRARVHGAFYDAYATVAAAVRQLAQSEPLAADEALIITGHSLGGALAALAANDLGTRMHAGRQPRARMRLLTFGKPVVGDAAFAAGVHELRTQGVLEFAGRWALSHAGRLDPVTTADQHLWGFHLPGFRHGALGAPFVWVHESPLRTLPCGVKARHCHSMKYYASQAARVAADPAAELSPCELLGHSLHDYSSLSLCGATLKRVAALVGLPQPVRSEACVGVPTTALEARGIGAFGAAVLQIVLFWLLVRIFATAFVRAVAGDRRWWAGPYLPVPRGVRRVCAALYLMEPRSRPSFSITVGVSETFFDDEDGSLYPGDVTHDDVPHRGRQSLISRNTTSVTRQAWRPPLSTTPEPVVLTVPSLNAPGSRAAGSGALSAVCRRASTRASQASARKLSAHKCTFCFSKAGAPSAGGSTADGASIEKVQTSADRRRGSLLQVPGFIARALSSPRERNATQRWNMRGSQPSNQSYASSASVVSSVDGHSQSLSKWRYAPRLQRSLMPLARMTTGETEPMIVRLFPSFCRALEVRHSDWTHSPIAGFLLVVAGLIAVNSGNQTAPPGPVLASLQVGLFEWEAHARLPLLHYGRWWLIFPAYGGDLLEWVAYTVRLAAYTLLFGLMSMGNVRGASTSAQVIALVVGALYAAALVLTHRAPLGAFAGFYYVAIATANAANVAFLLPRVLCRLPCRVGWMPRPRSPPVKSGVALKCPPIDCCMSSVSAVVTPEHASHTPAAPPDVPLVRVCSTTDEAAVPDAHVSTDGPLPSINLYKHPSRIVRARKANAASRTKELWGAALDSPTPLAQPPQGSLSPAPALLSPMPSPMPSPLPLPPSSPPSPPPSPPLPTPTAPPPSGFFRTLSRTLLSSHCRERLAIYVRRAGSLLLHSERPSQGLFLMGFQAPADGFPRVPFTLVVLFFCSLCLFALTAWLLAAVVFPWTEDMAREIDAALGPMAESHAADNVGLSIVSPRLYEAFGSLLALALALAPFFGGAVRVCCILGLSLSALLSVNGSFGMWTYYVHTYQRASSQPSMRTRISAREKYALRLALLAPSCSRLPGPPSPHLTTLLDPQVRVGATLECDQFAGQPRRNVDLGHPPRHCLCQLFGAPRGDRRGRLAGGDGAPPDIHALARACAGQEAADRSAAAAVLSLAAVRPGDLHHRRLVLAAQLACGLHAVAHPLCIRPRLLLRAGQGRPAKPTRLH